MITQAPRSTETIYRSHGFRPRFAVATASAAAMLLAGCSGGALSKDFGVGAPVATVRHYTGNVFGGQQPISGATIQLYAVSNTLHGASAPLISLTPTAGQNVTDANGNFNITGLYDCTGASDVYITAAGGDGISAGQANTATVLMAALGDCATLQTNAANIFINVNELTTVAAAYALSPFATDYTHVGSPNATALTNSFNTAAELVNIGNGVSPGVAIAPGATVQSGRINTLGDIIAACVNTSSPSSTQCTTLLGTTGAADTFGALLAITRDPGNANYTALYSLPTGIAPFQPSATSQPNDFTLAVNYTASGNLLSPFGIALDATGNAWVTNEAGTTITELSSNGAVLALPTAAGLYGPQGIAVDRSGNIWVANTAGNSIVEFTVAGGTVTGSQSYTAGGVTAPTALALDSANNVFVSNYNGNSVTGLTSAGVALAGSPFTAGGSITNPSGLVVDASRNVLVTSGNGSVIRLTNAGALSATLTDNTLQGPLAVAVDGSGNVFATGSTTGAAVSGAVAEFSAANAASGVSPLAGVTTPFGLATDGAYIYVANNTATGGISKLQYGSAAQLSPASGFGYDVKYTGTSTIVLNTPTAVAIDASGNLWSTNTGNNTVSKFVGLAAPVVTPVSANVGP